MTDRLRDYFLREKMEKMGVDDLGSGIVSSKEP
mgnify:CR=1 FL=1